MQEVCPWFPEEGSVNSETQTRVEKQIKDFYSAHRPEKVPVDVLRLWGLIRDTLAHEQEAGAMAPPTSLESLACEAQKEGEEDR